VLLDAVVAFTLTGMHRAPHGAARRSPAHINRAFLPKMHVFLASRRSKEFLNSKLALLVSNIHVVNLSQFVMLRLKHSVRPAALSRAKEEQTPFTNCPVSKSSEDNSFHKSKTYIEGRS
jgi:hypothetical protein